MSNIVAARLYFPLSAKAQGSGIWHRVSSPSLGRRLIREAKRAKIEQVMMLNVQGGYLPGQPLAHWHAESGSRNLIQCIELVDVETKLKKFLHEHQYQLHQVRVIFFHVEILRERHV